MKGYSVESIANKSASQFSIKSAISELEGLSLGLHRIRAEINHALVSVAGYETRLEILSSNLRGVLDNTQESESAKEETPVERMFREMREHCHQHGIRESCEASACQDGSGVRQTLSTGVVSVTYDGDRNSIEIVDRGVSFKFDASCAKFVTAAFKGLVLQDGGQSW